MLIPQAYVCLPKFISSIIAPYVESIQHLLGDKNQHSSSLTTSRVTGQVTASVNTPLEEHNIHVCLLPPNATTLFQPVDISLNKPAKDFPNQWVIRDHRPWNSEPEGESEEETKEEESEESDISYSAQ